MAAVTVQLEEVFGEPIDCEWAIVKKHNADVDVDIDVDIDVVVLQARPITAIGASKNDPTSVATATVTPAAPTFRS